jgi:isocitrate/isopropylmalate dehydrogenase
MDKILILPGDGIGPAAAESARAVLGVAADGMEILVSDIGSAAFERTGSLLPHDTLELADECKTALCGPVDLGIVDWNPRKDPITNLRVQLDLYAVWRRFRTLSEDIGMPDIDTALWSCSPVPGKDILETEDLGGVTLTKYVRKASYSRMMVKAMSMTEISRRRKVACITSDTFPESSAMFTECFMDVFGTGGFELSAEPIQRWAAFAARRPSDYETLVCVDLFGKVAGGVLAGLTGGNHLSPSAYIGDEYFLSVSPAPHEHVEPGYVNPTSMIVGGYMALYNNGRTREAEAVMEALCAAYRAGERTPDVGGTLTTDEFTERVIRRI